VEIGAQFKHITNYERHKFEYIHIFYGRNSYFILIDKRQQTSVDGMGISLNASTSQATNKKTETDNSLSANVPYQKRSGDER
jgi:hypothetical protein